jgi:ribosomal subunit interface protein
VEIVITGRRTEIQPRFRRLAEEKLSKVGQLAPRAHRVDVEVSHERNPRQAATAEKVEITVRDKGPVIRAEANAEDSLAAFDIAFGKLLERLRRTRDRRKVHHGRQTPPSLRQQAPEAVVPSGVPLVETVAAEHVEEAPLEDSPVVIRTKDHAAIPMTLDQALYEMELVGHDFFLFIDADSGLPSVVYRRRGWNYGVIRLRAEEAMAESSATPEPVPVGS